MGTAPSETELSKNSVSAASTHESGAASGRYSSSHVESEARDFEREGYSSTSGFGSEASNFEDEDGEFDVASCVLAESMNMSMASSFSMSSTVESTVESVAESEHE